MKTFCKAKAWVKRHSQVVAMALVVVPFLPVSFSVDLSGLITYAADFFNSLVGAFVPIWGLMLGIAILGFIGAAITGFVKMKK